ncbi:unnamed protein product [Protopolystoma xenopodis]|uniref:Uncharacterized protein n=1 Tax=Protopolystoma xenopodis TaxID=117903 RepID=A0A448XLS5_9PLAT|nr:unnamed protein product [Protopolystoma xenopodis]
MRVSELSVETLHAEYGVRIKTMWVQPVSLTQSALRSAQLPVPLPSNLTGSFLYPIISSLIPFVSTHCRPGDRISPPAHQHCFGCGAAENPG